MALDRDEDLLLDGVETNTGVYLDPQHTGSNPALADTDGDGFRRWRGGRSGHQPGRPELVPGPVRAAAGAVARARWAWAPWRA